MTQQPEAWRPNPLTGKSMGFGPFTYEFLLPVVVFGGGVGFLWMFGLPVQTAIFLVMAFAITFFLLTGNKTWRFFERFFRPRLLFRFVPYVDWNHIKGLPMPQKMKPQMAKQQGKPTKSWPIEAEFDLVGYGTTEISKPDVGFYVLHPRRDGPTGSHRQFAFVFAWEVWGYDPMLVEAEAHQALSAMELGFRRLTRNFIVTFEHSSTSDDAEYQRYLDRHLKKTTNPLAKALLYSQKAKIRSLQRRGLLQAKRTRIFVRYQIASADDRHKTSPLDHIMGFLGSIVSRYLRPWLDRLNQTNQYDKQQQQERFKLFIRAYRQQRNLHTLLNDTMKLNARPLPLPDLYESDYAELHNLSAPPLNQFFVLTRTGVKVQVRSRQHVLAQLFQPEKGVDPTPKTGHEWVHLRTKRKYVSNLQIGKVDIYPLDRGADRGMIRYLWNPIVQSGLQNYKILTQLQLSFQEGQKFDLGRQVRNSKRLVVDAERRSTVNINAEERLGDAIEGLQNLYNGRKIYETATTIWLYRNNPDALQSDFDTLVSLIPTPNTERTLHAAEYPWYQSFPFARHRLLTKPHKRLHDYYSHELPGLLPLISPLTLDKQGLFFLTKEGFSAFFIDLFEGLTHLAIFGTTRAGKSVVLGDICFNAYLRGIPVVAFDYPKETTGASTFTDLTNSLRKLGGSAGYNNIADCFVNFLQLPDLRAVPEPEERFIGVVDFQLRGLMILVMGELSNPVAMHEQIFKQSVKNLLSSCLKAFHSNAEIQGRYQAAIAAGHGSPEHANEPTLKDFVPYFATWFQDYKFQNRETLSDSDKEAGAFILSQLRGLLNTRLGENISRPSTFESDVSWLVFALKGISDNFQALVVQKSLERLAGARVSTETEKT